MNSNTHEGRTHKKAPHSTWLGARCFLDALTRFDAEVFCSMKQNHWAHRQNPRYLRGAEAKPCQYTIFAHIANDNKANTKFAI